ncbi:hypothetical protein SAMN05216565_11431 [Litchfieldia salsa]|uniref:Uncharacterized protein n=1 Tax=Litchfieldia salsa TaxID=930152 RepID=A0A1H0WRP1_9BACI|nr:hypothetical protein SAMN05216565_11431 [Litchfieldia salsa]
MITLLFFLYFYKSSHQEYKCIIFSTTSETPLTYLNDINQILLNYNLNSTLLYHCVCDHHPSHVECVNNPNLFNTSVAVGLINFLLEVANVLYLLRSTLPEKGSIKPRMLFKIVVKVNPRLI